MHRLNHWPSHPAAPQKPVDPLAVSFTQYYRWQTVLLIP